MIRKALTCAALAAVLLTGGAAKCEYDKAPKDRYFTWEVYLYTGKGKCGCDKLGPNQPGLSGSTNLLKVDYGFTCADWAPVTKTAVGVPTPWRVTDMSPKGDLSAIHMRATAADAHAVLICHLAEGKLELITVVGPGDGTCNAATDL